MRWYLCFAVLLLNGDLGAVAVRPDKKDPLKEEMKKLQGEWEIVSYIQNGINHSNTFVGTMTRIISGNSWTTRSGTSTVQYTFHIDVTKQPRAIDIRLADQKGKGPALLCIYKVEGDALTLCQSQGGATRPTRFVSESGSTNILTVAKRKRAK